MHVSVGIPINTGLSMLEIETKSVLEAEFKIQEMRLDSLLEELEQLAHAR